MFACMECGRKFSTTKAAQNASNNGCPKCGGVDIDLDPSPPVPKYNPPTAEARYNGPSHGFSDDNR